MLWYECRGGGLRTVVLSRVLLCYPGYYRGALCFAPPIFTSCFAHGISASPQGILWWWGPAWGTWKEILRREGGLCKWLGVLCVYSAVKQVNLSACSTAQKRVCQQGEEKSFWKRQKGLRKVPNVNKKVFNSLTLVRNIFSWGKWNKEVPFCTCSFGHACVS